MRRLKIFRQFGDDILDLDTERKPKFYATTTRHILGVDLGQAADYTALCALEHCHGIWDHGSDYERHTGQTAGLKLQQKGQRFRVIGLERLPLGTVYPRVVEHVLRRLSEPPLCGDGNSIKPAELIVDASGPGLPVANYFVEAGLKKTIMVMITAGVETKCAKLYQWNVSKHALISNLDALLAHDKHPLKFSTHLTESGALAEELRDFERHVGSAGRNTYSARSGKHDDLVLAVAIAAWWAARPPPAVTAFGRYGTYGDLGQTTFQYGGN
jgi:hypothetical protein